MELIGKVVFPCPIRWNIKEKPLKTYATVTVMEAIETLEGVAILENSYLTLDIEAPSHFAHEGTAEKVCEEIAVIKGSLKIAP
jgi:hypothetical protein